MPYELKFFDFPDILNPCLDLLARSGWNTAQIAAAKQALFSLVAHINTLQIGHLAPLIHQANADFSSIWNDDDKKRRADRLAKIGMTEKEGQALYNWITFEKGEFWLVENWHGYCVVFMVEPFSETEPGAFSVKWERIVP